MLRLIRPLYGLAELGTPGLILTINIYLEKLNMTTSTFDPCLIKNSNPTNGIIGMQTNDALLPTNPKLAEKEETELTFLSKRRQTLTTQNPIHFNGAIVKLESDKSMTISQSRQISKIELVQPDNPDSYIISPACACRLYCDCITTRTHIRLLLCRTSFRNHYGRTDQVLE
jgi:hypothetical protein